MNPFARKLTLPLCLALVACAVLISSSARAQQPAAPSVPHLVAFSGTVLDGGGQPHTGLTGVTFALYKDQEGGSPLWLETQSIKLDAKGHYAVELGSTKAEGIPADLFVSGEARWLGVRAEGQAEQPRVLLVSVPYAMKAADADTIGGRPASAFVLAAAPANSTGDTTTAAAPPPAAITGTGTTNFLPLWTGAATLGNSALFQTGTGATAKVGINTITPASPLDINGGTTFRGPANLVAIGNATAAAGKTSQFEGFAASAFSSSTAKAVAQTFRWQAEPTGNNTSAPSASFNLLFGSGTTVPAETGLRFGSNGQITFAPGQTFPGTGTGTITGVTAGTGLTGGGTTGNVSLSLLKTCATGQTLSWNGTAWVCANSSGGGTITGVTAGTSLSGGGTSGNVTLNLNLASTDLRYAQLGAANTFTQPQTIDGNLLLFRSDNTFNGTVFQVNNPNTASNSFAIVSSTAGTVSNVMYADGVGSGPLGTKGGYFGTFTNHPIGLFTGNVPRMYIGTDGSVGVGNRAPVAMFNIDRGFGLNSFLLGNNTSRGIVMRDNGTGTDIESVGVPLNINFTTQTDLFLNANAGTVGIRRSTIEANFPLEVGMDSEGSSALFDGDAVAGNLFATNETLGGNLTVFGDKNFRIDHPLDPEHKYLKHAALESSEVLNFYTGNVVLNSRGEGVVHMPDWFQAINENFRYQLTAIGAPGPNLYVAEEVHDNTFRIAGGTPGMKVSWQVTCNREDAYHKAYPYQAEQDKPEAEFGYYAHPEIYGLPAERSLKHLRELQGQARTTARNAARAKTDAGKQ